MNESQPKIENQPRLINKQNLPSILYWLLPGFLFLVQLIFTLNSTNQIRYEELAESVRNVFWLENRTLYDGVSSNLGWYGTLLVIYKSLGFSLFTAKIFRLALGLLSLFALAAILRKYLGIHKAWIPLLTLGLSPTLLFFNTLQTSYGMDLQYFPIALYLLVSINFSKFRISCIKIFLLGIVSMIAWMSYPTFVSYLLTLGLISLYKIWLERKEIKLHVLGIYISLAVVSFLLPLFSAYFYVKDPVLLIHDSKTQSGIFRGAGTLYLDRDNFFFNLGHTAGDLFYRGDSYYFEIVSGDFSQIYPVLTLLVLVLVSLILLFKNKKYRFPIALAYILLFSGTILSNLTFDPSGRPGIRRNTPILVALYTLFILTWYKINSTDFKDNAPKKVLIVFLLLLPLHHILALPANLESLSVPSPYKYSYIFGAASTPSESLKLYVDAALENNLKLVCQDQQGNLVFCRYVEGYAAVAGSCVWNSLPCNQITGYDAKTSQFIPLKTSIWETYYWEH